MDAIERLSLSVAPASRHLGFLPLVGEDGMSRNALLRSVKGLGIPGTTRKDDKPTKLKVASPAPLGGTVLVISPSVTAYAAPAYI